MFWYCGNNNADRVFSRAISNANTLQYTIVHDSTRCILDSTQYIVHNK